jgi:hypothetical protein
MTVAVTMRCPACGRSLTPGARDHREDPTCGWRASDGPRPSLSEPRRPVRAASEEGR